MIDPKEYFDNKNKQKDLTVEENKSTVNVQIQK